MTLNRCVLVACAMAFTAVTTVVAAPPDWAAASADEIFTGEGELTWFGARALAIGDCDGDQIEDLLIAARFDSRGFFHNGRCTVYSGATNNVLHVFDGEGDNDELGHRLDRIGDLDGDGRADILLGAYQHANSRGRVYAYSGRTGELLHVWTGEQDYSLFGWGLSNAGDTNGDGVNDVVISSVTYNGPGPASGAAYLYDGRTGALRFRWVGETPGEQFGFRVAAIGDVDGDGRSDVAIGAPYNSENGTEAGKVSLYSGRTGELIRSYLGENPGDRLGERFCGDFDLNGDNHSEVLIASVYFNSHGVGTGRVYLYSGIDGSLMRTFDGERRGDQLGYRIRTFEDLDGDHVPEIVASALYADGNGVDSGSVYIYSGRTLNLMYRYDGERANDRLGRVIQDIGDINNDGNNDFAIGSPFVSTPENGVEVGRAYVYSGRTGKLLLRITGEAAGDQFGYSIKPGGDVNGDGIPDFTVGAVYNDAGGPDAGRAYVFFGRPIYASHTRFKVGAPATVTVTGAKPGETIHLLLSLRGIGVGPRSAVLGGARLSLLPPVSEVGSLRADGFGNRDFALVLPPELARRTLYMQAAIRRGPGGRDSVLTNPIAPYVNP